MSQAQTIDLPLLTFRYKDTDPVAPPREHAPEDIHRVRLTTGQTVWLATRHEDVRQLLRDPAFSSDWTKPGFPMLRPVPPEEVRHEAGMFLQMDAPEHTRYRRLLTAEFMIKRIRALEPLIHQTVLDALESMRASGPPADLVQHFALPVPSKVICHLLGVPYADHAFFQDRSRTMLAWSTPVEDVMVARDELFDYMAELVTRRQHESGGEDLVSRIAVEHVATGDLTSDDLVGMALLLLVAGHETTANMIGLSALALLTRPDQLRRLREQPDRIDDAVEELLRYLTIVRTGLSRVAIADTDIGGHPIKAGEGVIASLSAANQDGVVFEGAEEFDVGRGSHQHMAFGFGVHQCLGQPLARAELRIALSELITRFPDLALAVDPSEVHCRDAFILGLQELPVRW